MSLSDELKKILQESIQESVSEVVGSNTSSPSLTIQRCSNGFVVHNAKGVHVAASVEEAKAFLDEFFIAPIQK